MKMSVIGWLAIVPLTSGMACAREPQARLREVYRVDDAEFRAREKRAPTAEELRALRDQVLAIERQRLEGKRWRGVELEARGDAEFVVTAPASVDAPSPAVELALAEALDALATTLKLAESPRAPREKGSLPSGFPLDGGELRIEGERLTYTEREGVELRGVVRGAFGTTAAAHAATSVVQLTGENSLRRLLEARGTFDIAQELDDRDSPESAAERRDERKRLDAWRAQHPRAPLEEFHQLATDAGGPGAGVHWFPRHQGRTEPDHEVELHALRFAAPPWRFTRADLDAVEMSKDYLGRPAFALDLRKERQSDFADFTASIVDRVIAIVIDSEIYTLATVTSRLQGSFIVEGGASGFSKSEVEQVIASLKHGPLPAPVSRVSRDASMQPK